MHKILACVLLAFLGLLLNPCVGLFDYYKVFREKGC